MATTYDKASLVLIPSGTKEGVLFSQKPTNGDGDFTFSRSTSATRVGPSGYIEKERTNYVRYSQDFSQWSILGGATITTGVTDPNGGSTAATISNIGAGSLSDGIAIFNNPMTIGAGGVVSQSIYLKGSGTIAIAMERGVSGTYFFYQKTITLTSTWQRFDNFQQIGSAADGFHFYVANYTGTTATSVDIAFAQFEFGTAPSEYIATTTSAVTTGITDNIPRLDYTDSSCPSLLLEPQRTNYVRSSEFYDTASNWILSSGCVVEDNFTISPEGLQNASKVTLSGGAANYMAINLAGFGLVSGDVTLSCWAKADSNITIGMNDGNVNPNAINLTTDWQRFEFTFNYTGGGILFQVDNYFGVSPANQEKVFYLWGVQAEQGSYATSYIPTYGSAVTRNADYAQKNSIANLFGTNEGSFLFEATLKDGSIPLFLESSDSVGYNYATYLQMGSTSVTLTIYRLGVSEWSVAASGYSESQLLKIGVAYKQNDIAFYVNGTQIATNNSANVSSNLSGVTIGRYAAAGDTFQYKGDVSKFILFPTRLTNEELAALTTI